MTVDDLLQVVPQLMSRIDSLETDLKQTKLTMGSAIVKLVKKGRKSQDDPLVSLVQGLVTPSKTTVNASGEEQVEDIRPTTLEAAKTLSRVASQKPKSIDKGRRYKRRKESKGKKVATSLDFQEEVNTSSIKVSTVSEQVSTGSTKSFEEVKEEFDKLVKQVESFAPINFEATKDSLKRFDGKERLHTDLDKDNSEDSDEVSEQDDSISSTKIPVNPVPVAMKSPSIATYKIIKQGEKGVYQIIREDGTDIVYINFGAMLKDISKDDLTELYRIVMNRYGIDGPEDELEKPLSAEITKLCEDKKLQEENQEDAITC
ncbi:hypothetical protein Tco_0211970 [Tanacetum coccineum]